MAERVSEKIDGQNELALHKLQTQEESSLGDFNAVLFPPDFSNSEAVRVLQKVTAELIAKFGGVQPVLLEAARVFNSYAGKEEPRFVARFEVGELTAKQLDYLQELVKGTYGGSVKTYSYLSGSAVVPSPYFPLEQDSSRKISVDHRLLGWYMGPNLNRFESTHMGLLVHRDIGNPKLAPYLKAYSPGEWFFDSNLSTPTRKKIKPRYLVEIREGRLYQTDLVELNTQTAHILGRGEPLDRADLKYEIYNRLNRLGIKKVTPEDIYGLDAQIATIRRVLISPLSNQELSRGLGISAESLLFIGVPGTGKTLVAQLFLQEDCRIFIVPVRAADLALELISPPEKQWIFPRLSEIKKQTGIPVIIQIDDIETIVAGNEDQSKTALINLLAGVRDSGFYIMASTNHPEKMPPALLQPQRLRPLYFGLPTEEARYRVLDIHTPSLSRELQKPLFRCGEDREMFLRAIASCTEGFAPGI